jgi:thiol-disulfide isomerase/thioredoxin
MQFPSDRIYALNQITRLSLLLTAITSASAWALDVVPYEADGFTRARGEGKVTAIQFHSGWCPVCVMQERGVKALKDDKSLEGVTVFQADYFKEETLRKRFNVSSFSTLVVFRGDQERARTTGDFRAEQLKQLFAKAL